MLFLKGAVVKHCTFYFLYEAVDHISLYFTCRLLLLRDGDRMYGDYAVILQILLAQIAHSGREGHSPRQ